MLDLAVRLGVVGAVLHLVDVGRPYCEGCQYRIEPGARDEDFGGLRPADDTGLGGGGHIDAFGLAVPHIDTAIAYSLEALAFDIDIDRSGGGNDRRLIARHLIVEGIAGLQLHDVEVVEGNAGVIDVDDRAVGIVEGRNVHGSVLLRPRPSSCGRA